jgi:serine kinase of HPr protein (carbohydrate metabolism regulator)
MAIHATTIAMAGQAVLFFGPSGSGKSQLALRTLRLGAWLIADDQTHLFDRDGLLWASSPPVLAGRLEVRGVGISAAPQQRAAPIALVLNLEPRAAEPERMPEFSRWQTPPEWKNTRPIPCVPFDAFRPDAAEAVIAALAHAREWEDSPALKFGPCG